MGKIIVWNCHGNDDFSSKENNYYIGRSKDGNILANPFSFDAQKSSLAKLTFKTREEALEAYKEYFKRQYESDEYFKEVIDEIYEKQQPEDHAMPPHAPLREKTAYKRSQPQVNRLPLQAPDTPDFW